MCSFYFVDFVHVVHNEIFNNSLVGDLGHHAIDSLTAQIVHIGILFQFDHTFLHSSDY